MMMKGFIMTHLILNLTKCSRMARKIFFKKLLDLLHCGIYYVFEAIVSGLTVNFSTKP